MLGGCAAMGIFRAQAVSKRVRQLRAYERLLAGLTGELEYRRDILSQMFARLSEKCEPPFSEWLAGLSRQLVESYDGAFPELWREHADRLYDRSGLKREDMEYIYELGHIIGYLDVQAQKQQMALLSEEFDRHVKRQEAQMQEKMRISFAVCGTVGILLVILLC